MLFTTECNAYFFYAIRDHLLPVWRVPLNRDGRSLQDQRPVVFQSSLQRLAQKHSREPELILRLRLLRRSLVQDNPAELLVGRSSRQMRRHEITISVDKVSELKANRVTGLPDANRLQHSRVPQLLEHAGHIELHRRLLGVWLDTPDEPRIASSRFEYHRSVHGSTLRASHVDYLLRHGIQQLLKAVVKPGRDGRGSRLHRDESAVWLVHRLVSFVSGPHVLEHFADHL